jgi:hypothetical protein
MTTGEIDKVKRRSATVVSDAGLAARMLLPRSPCDRWFNQFYPVVRTP